MDIGGGEVKTASISQGKLSKTLESQKIFLRPHYGKELNKAWREGERRLFQGEGLAFCRGSERRECGSTAGTRRWPGWQKWAVGRKQNIMKSRFIRDHGSKEAMKRTLNFI